MDVPNRNSYYNAIYEAIVVNDDTNSDPEGLGRVQIYIPYIHIQYAETYEEYMNSTNKQEQDGWNIFPWAQTTMKNLKNGYTGFCNNINNDNSKYLIFGLDAGNPVNDAYFSNLGGNSGSLSNSLFGSANGLIDLTMPIVVHNEVGLDINAWPNNITDEQYTHIEPYDNGGWTIGVIQWHEVTAYDCMFQIAKADVNSFKTIVSKYQSNGNSLDLANSLLKSVEEDSSKNQRNSYTKNYHPMPGTAVYNFIQEVLGSPIGKETQIKYGSEEIQGHLDNQANEFGIKNPAVMIFLADIMNQYGPNITKTKRAAASICTEDSSKMISELDQFRDWCKGNLGDYYKYERRRNTTRDYIVNLYNEGKLNFADSTNLAGQEGANMGGELLWPVPACHRISSPYGERIHPIYGTRKFHKGIDIAGDESGAAMGKEIIATHSGTISFAQTGYNGGYGNKIDITNGSMTTCYCHQKEFANGIKEGVNVTAGQVIGYVGSTGASTGPHLHFEVRINGETTDPVPYVKKG